MRKPIDSLEDTDDPDGPDDPDSPDGHDDEVGLGWGHLFTNMQTKTETENTREATSLIFLWIHDFVSIKTDENVLRLSFQLSLRDLLSYGIPMKPSKEILHHIECNHEYIPYVLISCATSCKLLY